MELPLHRWQDRKREAPVPQGAESRPEGWLPPLPAGECTSPGHCSRLPGPQRVGWSQSPGLQWLKLEVCGLRAQAVPPRRLSPHLARPHNARPLSSLSVRLWEAPGLLKDQHKTLPQVCPAHLMEMV